MYDVNSYRNKATTGKRLPADKIIAYIKQHFLYKERKNGEEYVINNPLNGDTGYHFNINPHKGICHDWRGDEWAGPINPETNKRNCSFVKFIRIYKKCSYAEAIKEIIGTGVDLRSYLMPENRLTDEAAQRKVAVSLPKGTLPLSTADDIQAQSLKKWLKTRGYTEQSIASHGLCYLGMDVYWQSRSRLNKRFNFPPLEITDDNGKVIGKTEGSKGDFLYGFDEVEPAGYVIITEAIFDQHTLGTNTVASGGAVLTNNQINKLRILGPGKGIILSPDNDNAGMKSIISNYSLLNPLGYKIYYSLPPKLSYQKDGSNSIVKDWNELGQYVVGFDKVREHHDKAIKLIDASQLVSLHERMRK